MGFGHRVYKHYDPRARIIKRVADEVFELTGHNRLLDIALELERIALEDEYFISRKLYPNVGFLFRHHLSGHGFASDNVSGDVRHPAHSGLASAMAGDDHRPEQKDHPPRQIFVGQPRRELRKQKA